MNKSTIAKIYAKGLIPDGLDNAAIDARLHALETAWKAISSTPSLQQFFASPEITREQKQSVMKKTLQGIDPAVSSFLTLLIEKDRYAVLPYIVKACRKLADLNQGTVAGKLTTPFPISDDELAQIVKMLERRQGSKRVALTTKIDPSLLAGGILSIGNEQIDFSAKGSIDALKKNLLSSPLTQRNNHET